MSDKMKAINRILYYAMIPLLCISCSKDSTVPEPPAEPGTVEVRGTLVDIRSLVEGDEFFPQNTRYTVPGDAAACFDGPMNYAVSLKEYPGPSEARSGSDGVMTIASDIPDLSSYGWTPEEKQFTVGDITYYLHSRNCSAGEWLRIPHPEESECSAIVFASSLKVRGAESPWPVVAQVPVLREGVISNVCIAILPDGTYVASCTGASLTGRVSLYRSEDRGVTWEEMTDTNVQENGVSNYYNLFVHDGSLYMMGAGTGNANVVISRSDDGGKTWTVPQSAAGGGEGETAVSGILLEGSFHSAAVPVLISGGRIWRAMEEVSGEEKNPFVMSAPVDSDLLSPANWTRTNTVTIPDGLALNEAPLTELIEGNMVATPAGDVFNILRASSSQTSLAAVSLQVTDENTLATPSDDDVVKLPGGGKKFTIRYDAKSGYWWALTNPASEDGMTHEGIYSSGITYNLIRNRLVLVCSKDLVTWVQWKQILYDEDPFFHGFQYVDWQFDGNDIIAVCRMACPEGRGLPVRQHDANFMTFHRIKNFRTL